MHSRIALIALALPLGCAQLPAGKDVTVLSAGAVEPGLVAAVAQFEKATGKRVALSFNTAPQIRERIAKGERFDVVIVPPALMDTFAKEGRVAPERVMLGSVGQGLAVHAGASIPEVSSVEAMKRALREADAVVFNRATGGQYIEAMLKKIDIYPEIEGKTVRYESAGEVMRHLAKGSGREIGFGPIPEIMMYTKKGVGYVGPLPAEVQQKNAYVAAPMRDAGNAESAAALARFLGTPAAKSALAAGGVE
ncbi:MAG: molybdate ABC transporter substrate-binding protein [Burkholderiales bacterium]